MPKIIIDPEFRGLIPPQSEDEHKGLEDSLLKQGCRDALCLWGNILIDGHNRYEICTKHKIPFQTQQVEGIEDRFDATVWIVKNQLSRRNLQMFQACELALTMEGAIAEKAKAKMESTLKQNTSALEISLKRDEPIHTDVALGQMAGVSDNTIRRARTILKEGTDEQKQRARTGGKGNTVNAVYRDVIGKAIERRNCTTCGQEFSETSFLKSGTVCSKCRRSRNDAESREIMAHVDAAVAEVYNQDKEIIYKADDMEVELSIMVSTFTSRVRRLFDIRESALDEPGAKEKMTAVLSEAAAAMNKAKEFLL